MQWNSRKAEIFSSKSSKNNFSVYYIKGRICFCKLLLCVDVFAVKVWQVSVILIHIIILEHYLCVLVSSLAFRLLVLLFMVTVKASCCCLFLIIQQREGFVTLGLRGFVQGHLCKNETQPSAHQMQDTASRKLPVGSVFFLGRDAASSSGV